jgi:DNA polymerase III subunit chi
MKQVVFVEIPRSGKLQFFRTLCAFVARHVGQSRTVALLAGNRDQARYLDELLWTFDESTFLPHSILSAATSPLEGAIITLPGQEAPAADLTINFATEVVPDHRVHPPGDSPCVYEMVPAGDDAGREAARGKWNRYREKGLAVSHQQGF